MNGQELATAVHYGLNIIFIVINNGMYGTIRMHQEREYPGRVYGTEFTNPDFAALARAYGAHGETVAATAQSQPVPISPQPVEVMNTSDAPVPVEQKP